jgi:hypothetical protein
MQVKQVDIQAVEQVDILDILAKEQHSKIGYSGHSGNGTNGYSGRSGKRTAFKNWSIHNRYQICNHSFLMLSEGTKMLYRNYLEINLLTQCTLRCSNCAVASPHLKPNIYAFGEFAKDISELAKVIRLEEIRFVGGEPTMVKNIDQYVKVVRKCGIAKRVSITTNGTLLENLSDDVIRSFDDVYISIYEDKEISDSLKEKVKRGWFRAAVLTNVIYQFWTQFHFTELVGKVDDVNKIWRECRQPQTCNSLYQGFVFLCSQGRFRGEFLQAMKYEGAEHLLDPNLDGCAIHTPNLEERLDAYLNRTQPLEACSYCTGDSGDWVEHRQITREKE